MNKKKFLLVGALLFLSLVFLTACTEEEIPVVVDSSSTPTGNLETIAEGEILPVDERSLAFKTGGILSQVNVEEGDRVQQGDVLAVLGNTLSLDAQKASLELELLTAQQSLDDLNQNADVDRETAWQAVLDAREIYNTAQEAYDAFDKDAFDDDLEQAEEDIIDAQQAVDDAKDELADYLDLDAENATRKRYEDDLDVAEDNLNEKQRAKSALENEWHRIESEYLTADAALQVAQEEYEKRKDGPDTDTVEQLEAQIYSINAQLTAVEEEIASLTLTAPFEGEIVKLNYAENEFVPPGSIVMLVADTSEWVIESTDLTELEVAKLFIGQTVSMEADAFKGENFTGVVERISSYPESKQGDVLYTVHIKIDEGELPELRWGMTLMLIFNKSN